jgi:hypothetical protein
LSSHASPRRQAAGGKVREPRRLRWPEDLRAAQPSRSCSGRALRPADDGRVAVWPRNAFRGANLRWGESQMGGRAGKLGCAGGRNGRRPPGRLQAHGGAPRPCRMVDAVGEEVMIERGREQFGEQLARSRSARRKGGRPRWLSRWRSSGSAGGGWGRLSEPELLRWGTPARRRWAGSSLAPSRFSRSQSAMGEGADRDHGVGPRAGRRSRLAPHASPQRQAAAGRRGHHGG